MVILMSGTGRCCERRGVNRMRCYRCGFPFWWFGLSNIEVQLLERKKQKMLLSGTLMIVLFFFQINILTNFRMKVDFHSGSFKLIYMED